MAIGFDPVTKRIILDSPSVTAEQIWSAWENWAVLSDNLKYGPVMTHVGGDELGGGLYIPNYIFLENGWRVRPMEANHTLVITGNLFVKGGGVPVVNTLGTYNVSVQYTVPVQAQAIATGGGGAGGLTGEQAAQLAALWQRFGLDPANPLVTSANSIQAGLVTQTISESSGVVTVSRT